MTMQSFVEDVMIKFQQNMTSAVGESIMHAICKLDVMSVIIMF